MDYKLKPYRKAEMIGVRFGKVALWQYVVSEIFNWPDKTMREFYIILN